MATWARVQSLPGIRDVYGPHFPLEMRHFFSAWLESQPWHTVNENDEGQKGVAQVYFDTLLKLMRGKIEELQSGSDDMFLLRLRLEEISGDFEKRYSKDALRLVRVIKTCLRREKDILDGTTISNATPSPSTPGVALDEKTMTELSNLQKQAENAETQLKSLQQQQEFFVIQYQELCKLQAFTNAKADAAATTAESKKRLDNAKTRRAQLERLLSEEGSKILRTRKVLAAFYQEILGNMTTFTNSFINEKLDKFKSLQCLGMTSDDDQLKQLDCLQPECERMVETLWMIRQQIRQLHALQEQLLLKPEEQETAGPLTARLMNQCTVSLRTLLQSSFILEKQPPQVLKTQTKFTCTARLLVGGKLNIFMSPPEVRASIISQQQARQLAGWAHDLHNNVPQSAQMLESLSNVTGTLLNDRKVFEYFKENQTLKCMFKNLSLKKIKRRDTKSDEVVTEEKFAMLLHTFFVVGDISFCVYVQTNPSVVIVHGNQYANAVATVLWDNFFGEKNREPFVVPESVPWSMAAMALNNHFAIANRVPLKDSDLLVLKYKILGNSGDGLLSWTAFNREALPQRSFTFWEWFYGVEEVVKKHIHGPWCDGLVVGFISKKDAENLLLQREEGTFLLRFSDSEIGGISVAYAGNDGSGNKKVWHLQPWFSKDLMIRSLADRLGDLSQLTFLYPNRFKDEAFRRYYSAPPGQTIQTAQDYIRTSIAATVLMDNLNISSTSTSPSASSSLSTPKHDLNSIKVEHYDIQDWSLEDTQVMMIGDTSDFLSNVLEPDSAMSATTAAGPSGALNTMALAAAYLGAQHQYVNMGGNHASSPLQGDNLDDVNEDDMQIEGDFSDFLNSHSRSN